MQCFTSKSKLFGLLILTCIAVAASFFCTTLPELKARIAGWAGVGFFGLGFIAFPIMLFRSGPQVIINELGIEDVRLKVGVIPWEEITSISIGSVRSTKFLCIEILEEEKYFSKFPKWKQGLVQMNRAIGFPMFTLSFSGLSPGIDEVWAYLQDQYADLIADAELA